MILRWADAHHRRTGKWPTVTSGPVVDCPGETWAGIHGALAGGYRGLRGTGSLARLLEARRGYRNRANLPRLTVAQILKWADAHHRRTGRWPTRHSGPIRGAPGETWLKIETALGKGHRGLPRNSSIARLLAEHRGRRNLKALPRLTIAQILTWADAHHRRTGRWPGMASGPVVGAPGENWRNIENSLRRGDRGLPGDLTLAGVLSEHRGVRNTRRLPRLTERQILAWARAHRRRTGRWPTRESGAVVEAPGETWRNLDTALYKGLRGFPGQSSLARLFAGARR